MNKLQVLKCMLGWKQGHMFHSIAVSDLVRVNEASNASLRPGPHANIGQSGVCVDLQQLVILANSVTQDAGVDWHIEVEARPLTAPNSCCRLSKGSEGMCQQYNASAGPRPHSNIHQSCVWVSLQY